MKFISLLVAVGSMAAFASELNGTWTGGCHNGVKFAAIIDNNHLVMTKSDHFDSVCAVESAKTVVAATFQVGAESQFVKGAMENDWTIAKIELMPTSVGTVAKYNVNHFCGLGDWSLNQAKEITGLKCDQIQMPKSGDRRYDLYQLPNPKSLVHGKLTAEFDGTSPEKRPRELDMEDVLVRN